MASGRLQIRAVAERPAGRVGQFLHALRCRHDRGIDDRLRMLLDDERQWSLLARLAPYDRAHHLDVHERLVTAGFTDADLLRAALLHDVGKADERGRVRLQHRVARVILRRALPGPLRRIGARPSRIWHGMYLAENHAELGAHAAREAGASASCCELIAAHESEPPGSDPALAALIAADEGLPL
jgi:putative nucleotidyltransferase with HDIG domain